MTPVYQKNELGLVIYPTPLGDDLTGYTITVYITKPSATLVTKSGSIVSAVSGQTSWTTASTNLDEVGEYTQQVKYVSGGTTKYGPMETFYVDNVLA